VLIQGKFKKKKKLRIDNEEAKAIMAPFLLLKKTVASFIVRFDTLALSVPRMVGNYVASLKSLMIDHFSKIMP